ncbi:MAG: hypothetical protein C0625_16435 [Arcobacter sp.]|nr:MAG: hypothetical protein C0625_16435 [Arcobacter sp.]
MFNETNFKGTKIQFDTIEEYKYLKDIAHRIVEILQSKFTKIDYFWLDFGSTYDLHIEVCTNGIEDDLYFILDDKTKSKLISYAGLIQHNEENIELDFFTFIEKNNYLELSSIVSNYKNKRLQNVQ